MADKFHGCGTGKRRGDGLPARLRFAARRGVTLVELLIAMLILAIVCVAWLEIIGIQSARREARRREAVERLAGMMDAFLYVNMGNNALAMNTYYRLNMTNPLGSLTFESCDKEDVNPMFESGVSPIGYQLQVVDFEDLADSNMFTGWEAIGKNVGAPLWLQGRLYDRNGEVGECGKPFFAVPVCMGPRVK